MGESAKNLPPAYPVLGEVDPFGWAGVGLGWGELAESAVRPGRVVVLQVFGQHPSQMVLIDDQQPVDELPDAGVPRNLSQIAFAFGACGGLATILMPSAVNTASNELDLRRLRRPVAESSL